MRALEIMDAFQSEVTGLLLFRQVNLEHDDPSITFKKTEFACGLTWIFLKG